MTGFLQEFGAIAPHTAALLSRSGNGWSLVASHGSPPPTAAEGILAGDLGAGPRRLEVEGDALLVMPLVRGGAVAGALLLRPSAAADEGAPALNLAVALLAWSLDAEHSGPLERPLAHREPPPGPDHQARRFVAVSAACRSLLSEADRIARTDLSVLVQGESGTGKELLARRIHALSRRAAGPLVAVNCSAIPRDLLEAELFGIERGVATGVQARPGRFTLASGGTIFLDEVGDLAAEVQPKLLRVLEDGHVTPLGAPAPIPLDVRLVAATNRDLGAEVESGRFRRDLYFRLKGALLTIPPLRERPDDILPLARAFARDASERQGRKVEGVDLQAGSLLLGYPWPGNVRELRHTINRAVALADGAILTAPLLPSEICGGSDADRGDVLLGVRDDWRTARARFDRYYFSRLIERCGGNLSEVSRLSGVSRSNLYRRLEELGLR